MAKDFLQEVGRSSGGSDEQEICEFIQYVVGSYIAYPKELVIEVMHGGRGLEVHCLPHAEDYGKICGTKGYMLQALCVIVKQLGSVMGMNIEFILEGKRAGIFNHIPPVITKSPVNEKWTMEMIRKPIEKILVSCGMENLTVKIRPNLIKTSSQFNVVGWKPEQMEFAEAFVSILRAIARRQGHDLIPEPSLGVGEKK
jgi:predicted RNA-binding protein YlqC (UPF0109 family)